MQYCMKKVPLADKADVLLLYSSLIGTDGCTWSAEYPNAEDVEKDIREQALYGLYCGGRLLAAAAAPEEEDWMHLACWDEKVRKPCGLARLGVAAEHQNLGLAKMLVAHVEQDVPKRGFDGVRLLVSDENIHAIGLYDAMGYACCGKASLYGMDWLCYEKNLANRAGCK